MTLFEDLQTFIQTRLFEGLPHTGRTFPIRHPATGAVIAHCPEMGAPEARQAADLAVEAFSRWKQSTAYERAALMRRWQALITRDETLIAGLMSLEMGKPITEARGEVRYALSFIEWYGEEAKRIYGEWIPSQFAHKRLWVIKQPVGPVMAITPWNFPAAMVTRKAAPALAAGCTFILKPAEQAPLTAVYLAQLWREAGGEPGVFQVLPTLDPLPVTDVLLEDDRIRKLSFTGSTEVGKRLYERSSHTLKRLSLELGGHAPILIFEDADLDAAVQGTAASKFRNAGQTCVCANRIYVQARIYETFAQKFGEVVRSLRVGDPLDENTQIGPLVDAPGLAKVEAHVSDALAGGAFAQVGGRVREGLFYEPTVLTGVRAGMRILEEETFGPVAPLIVFQEEAEVIAQANNVPYGLAAYLYTRDLNRAVRVSEALEYGIIGLNDGLPSTAQAPFGGVKHSGIGREGGVQGIEEYLTVKYISVGMG